MKNEDPSDLDLVELGTATEATRGGGGPAPEGNQFQILSGISVD